MYKITETQFDELPKELQGLYEKLPNPSREEVLECFPNSKSTVDRNPINRGTSKSWYTGDNVERVQRGDSGSAARFFYCAKASKKDRDEGLEGFENSILARSGGAQVAEAKGEEYSEGQGIGLNRVMQVKNNHPTVKPTALMRYLVKLVTPPGGTVLDPFTGSGSTGKACKLEGFEFIGIEREEEYVKIAEARIAAVTHQPTLV